MTVRVGSDQGPGFSFAANANRPDVAGVCGGYGNHGFDVSYPSSWKDGQTREIYVTANAGGGRFPDVLLIGAPRFITFPNVPLDSSVTSFLVPGVLQMGAIARATASFRNTGSTSWIPQRVDLAPINSPAWQMNPVPLPVTLARSDENVGFTLDVRAPFAEGVFNFALQLRHFGQPFGAVAQSSVRVLQPPNVYPPVTFPPNFQ